MKMQANPATHSTTASRREARIASTRWFHVSCDVRGYNARTYRKGR